MKLINDNNKVRDAINRVCGRDAINRVCGRDAINRVCGRDAINRVSTMLVVSG
ncbi:MAG: hypothetical protein KME54_07895 [Tolypothrix brevis GSE-NOS-MK-07-07A]|jgi:hypothetical protein|nr:hypothetical protein [Tolypothrix brevis GSE-NOS-MK-07-07A]